MAALTEADKREIVVLLAQFTSYSNVVVIMRNQCGVDVDRFQVRTYDPTNPRYAAGEKWREIFDGVRNAYLRSIETVPIAHKAFRLNALQRLLDKATASGNLVLACSILEQAAKEVGSALTHARSIAIERNDTGFRDLSADERRERVAKMLHEALHPTDLAEAA